MTTFLIILAFTVVPMAIGAGIAELMIRHAKRQARQRVVAELGALNTHS